MSDTVALALIAMFQSWGLAVIDKGPTWLGALAASAVTLGGWWFSRKVTQQHKAITEQVCAVREVAVTSSEQAELMAKGAERKGVEIGLETARVRASDLGALQASYKPEDTDVFMKRTGSP